MSLNNLAAAALAASDLETAEQSFEEALEIWRMSVGEHQLVTLALTNLAVVHQRRGDLERALERLEAARELEQRVLPPNHPQMAMTLNNLGNLHRDRGEFSRAVEVLERAYASALQAQGRDHPNTVMALWNREYSRIDSGDLGGAQERVESELARLDATGSEPSTEVLAEGLMLLVEARFYAGNLDWAEVALERVAGLAGLGPTKRGQVHLWRARLLLRRGQAEAAAEQARRALETLGESSGWAEWAHCVLGAALSRLGPLRAAEPWLKSCDGLESFRVWQRREAAAYRAAGIRSGEKS